MNRFNLTLLLVAVLSLGLTACTIYTNTGAPESPEAPAAPDAPEAPDVPATPEGTNPSDSAPAVSSAPQFPKTSLGGKLHGYVKIAVSHTDWTNGPDQRKTRKGEITDALSLKRALGLVGPKQDPRDGAATCMFSHFLDFLGNDGNIIGRVGICQSQELKKDHTGVFVKLDENEKTLSRQGIKIPDAQKLATLVENNLSSKR